MNTTNVGVRFRKARSPYPEMKRLIRNKQSQKLLTKEGTWTSDVSAALGFKDMDSVFRAARELTGVQLLLMAGDKPSSLDVVLPLKGAGD